MIDPNDITNFDRTDNELQEFWLFSTIVAGKTAKTQVKLLDRFISNVKEEHPALSIFESIFESDKEGTLDWHIEYARLGQYRRLEKCFRQSLYLDLRNDPIEAFEAVHGVGPKTARMFIMHSRPDQRVAALDTHLLKHLRANGYDAPMVTPSSPKKYRMLEEAFLVLADAAGETPADYDLRIWRSYADVARG